MARRVVGDGRPRNAPLPLEVDDVGEIARFERKVVRGPASGDCWVWTGALGDDGYGRFWLMRGGVARVVRPARYAVALYVGPVPGDLVAMHDRCDNPVCVRAATVGGHRPHVVMGTQRENLTSMTEKGRGQGGRPVWQHDGLTRAERVARSQALRAAVRGGWNAEAVHAALLPSRPSLFSAPEDWAT
ncbi:hypothetical protein [Nocardia salmonicida]|uniref:hypothetical protein n=1 Tax=Nocardia salmonicida TaxID=53431 RepID=UPI0034100A3F